jgi:hypothetical protein
LLVLLKPALLHTWMKEHGNTVDWGVIREVIVAFKLLRYRFDVMIEVVLER